MTRSTTYYHGGPEGLTEVLPPSVTGMPSCADYDDTGVIRRDRVYIITVAGEAEDFAMFAPTRGDVCVYEVVPVGAVEPDPDCLVPGVSFCCEAARVVRVVKHISSSSRHRALWQTTGEAI